MLRRRAEAARRRAAAAARASRGAARTTASDGFLDYPVRGYVTSPFGYRTHPIYGYYSLHDGTDFGAGCGSPLYAAAPGRVVSEYYSESYGNRLIIDHGVAGGKGVATILNHASHYVVGPGARVVRGQLVGYVGNTGWSTGCHLHFTVMANGRAVDPMRWF
nr:M23 family metallopeptidase [Nocardioides perillae]